MYLGEVASKVDEFRTGFGGVVVVIGGGGVRNARITNDERF